MTAATIGMVPSPVPAGRSAAEFLARARSFLAPIAYDALLRLCLAEIWLLFAAWVVKDVARIAGAKDCAAAVAASRDSAFCEDHFLYAFVIVMTLFVHRLDAADIRGAWMEVRCRTIMIELSGAIPFILLMIVGELMEALSAKGSRASNWWCYICCWVLGKGCGGLLRCHSNCGTEGVEGDTTRLG